MNKTERINKLALVYAQTKDERILNELYEQLEKDNTFIKLVGYTYFQVLQRKGMYLDKDDIMSELYLVVYQAAQGYNGTSNFLGRVDTFFKRRVVDLMRRRQYQKRKANTISFESISVDANDEMFTNENLLSSEDAENDCILTDAVKNFGLSGNERYARVISLLASGLTPEQASRELGFKEYDTTARKLISRARASFLKYWNLNQIAERS